MTDLVQFIDHPPLHEPTLLLALEGWIDAGGAAQGAARAILGAHSSEPIAEFNADELLDHRARRPTMILTEGVMTDLVWPSIELRALTDSQGRHVVILAGAEPDHAWGRFVGAVRDAAVSLGVQTVVGLGAYPAPVPHTRDSNLSLTSPSPDVLDSLPGFVRGTIQVPAGVQSAIEMSTHEAGLRSIGLWAQVPHYISSIAYPAASVALVEGLERVAGLSFEAAALRDEAAAGRSQLDELVAGNDQHREMVEQLEQMYDSQGLDALGPLPTGDQLAAEFQAFLRDNPDT